MLGSDRAGRGGRAAGQDGMGKEGSYLPRFGARLTSDRGPRVVKEGGVLLIRMLGTDRDCLRAGRSLGWTGERNKREGGLEVVGPIGDKLGW